MRGNDSSTSHQIYIYMYMCVYIPDFSSASTLNKSNFIQRISSCARDTVSWIRRFNDGTRSMANFFSKVWKAFSKKFVICILERCGVPPLSCSTFRRVFSRLWFSYPDTLITSSYAEIHCEIFSSRVGISRTRVGYSLVIASDRIVKSNCFCNIV